MVSIEYINKIREQAYRPEVVGAFIYEKKILFVYKEEHNLWQLAQGGIKEGENLKEAIIREMQEELDPVLIQNTYKIYYIMQYRIAFPKSLFTSRSIKSKDNILPLKGKHYFLLALLTKTSKIDLRQSDFDDAQWLNYKDALKLVEGIYQKRKKAMLKLFLHKLHKVNLL